MNAIYHADCFEIFPKIESQSVQLILCDLPYNTTQCSWDCILPLDKLWQEYERIIKPNGAIVLTAAQPFTSELVMSNKKLFKYEWIWRKTKAQHFAQAPYRPMTNHESVLVFSFGGTAKNANNRMKYNPQGIVKCNITCKGKKATHSEHRSRLTDQDDYVQEYTNYPKTVIDFANEGKTIHPTQKPLSLFEYIIETYTDADDLVLDNCAGSFTTAVACINTDRRYICIEKEQRYFELGKERIDSHVREYDMFSD
jgi:site-specific DNA-methyltransferase (adenine-specific)